MAFITSDFLVSGSEMFKISEIVRIFQERGPVMVCLKGTVHPVRLGATTTLQDVVDILSGYAKRELDQTLSLQKEEFACQREIAESINKLALALSSKNSVVVNQSTPKSATTLLVDLDLSIRTKNALNKCGLKTVADVYHYGNERLSTQLTKRGLKEINAIMDECHASIPD